MRAFLNVAVAPGLLIMIYVYKKDKIESEPFKLLLKLFLFGVLSIIPALLFELLGGQILYGGLDESQASLITLGIDNFLVVGLSEEFWKFFFLKLGSWKDKAFDYRFDAIVYAVTTGMGFAILENVVYVYNNGMGTGIMRALISLPGHASFAVCMGIYYGQAKYCELRGDNKGKWTNIVKAVLMPMLMHGLFDFCLSMEEDTTLSYVMIAVFFIYIITVDIICYRKVKRYSDEDARLAPVYEAEVRINPDGQAIRIPGSEETAEGARPQILPYVEHHAADGTVTKEAQEDEENW